MPRLITLINSVFLLIILGTAAFAQQSPLPVQDSEASVSLGQASAQYERHDEFSVRNAHQQGSLFWLPLGSFALPGLGQWIDGQYEYAALYSGVGLMGLTYSMQNTPKRSSALSADGEGQEAQTSPFLDNKRRAAALAGKIYETMGSLSAYHSFRAAVRTRQPNGQFRFLNHEEGIAELAKAPFEFSHFTNKSTWIPLSVFASLSLLSIVSPSSKVAERSLTGSDAFFTGSLSYSAGLGEEAVFRGWLMPLLREKWGSDLSANLTSSAIFALMHLGVTPLPVFQFFAGWYLGYVTQANEWKLGESIFLHSWWDVIAFAHDYATQKKNKTGKAAILWLPKLSLAF